jgi:dihydropyrimidinase
LWEGLASGYLQVVSTDHCPFDQASKNAGLSGGGWIDFTQIPGGLPGVEARLALIHQRAVGGEMSLERWVDLCCTTPARIFGLYPKKGCLEEGSDADVVVFDPSAERPLVPERLHSNVDYSVYENVVVRGWPRVVFSRGEVVARDGEPVGDAGRGHYIERGPSGRASEGGAST